jgi:hypothetical protein
VARSGIAGDSAAALEYPGPNPFRHSSSDIPAAGRILKIRAKTLIFQPVIRRIRKNLRQFLDLSQNLLDTSTGTP